MLFTSNEAKTVLQTFTPVDKHAASVQLKDCKESTEWILAIGTELDIREASDVAWKG